MSNRTIVMIVAALLLVVLPTAVLAAPAATAKPAVKPAAVKTAPAFDQKAALNKYWGMPDSTVVGSVNGEPVTKGELMKTLWLWNAPSTLSDMLTEKMIEQAAKKAHVSITQAQIKQKEDDAVKRMQQKSVDALLAQYKITWYRFMVGLRINTLAENTAQAGVKITDMDYAQWIKARHILIEGPAEEKDQAKKDADAKATADLVESKIKAGEDFAKLADVYSQDPGNVKDGKKQGGELGWFTRNTMVKAFEDAAFAMKPGEVSAPIKTQYGYHIIKVEELGRDTKGAERAELKKKIEDLNVPRVMQPWIQKLQTDTKMVNKLMGPPVPSAPGGPRMGPPQPGGPRAPGGMRPPTQRVVPQGNSTPPPAPGGQPAPPSPPATK